MTTSFTDTDLALLRRPLHGFLTVAAGPVPPQPRPVWYELADDGTVQLVSEADALKVRRLARDDRASLVVASPVGEREQWVSVTGRVTVETDGADDLTRRLADRYWDLSDPSRVRDLDAMLAGAQVRLVLHPEKVSRFVY